MQHIMYHWLLVIPMIDGVAIAIRMGIVGSPRRCGGQGDMLAGITAVCQPS